MVFSDDVLENTSVRDGFTKNAAVFGLLNQHITFCYVNFIFEYEMLSLNVF